MRTLLGPAFATTSLCFSLSSAFSFSAGFRFRFCGTDGAFAAWEGGSCFFRACRDSACSGALSSISSSRAAMRCCRLRSGRKW